MRNLFFLLMAGILFLGCKKSTSGAGAAVEFYLLQSYSNVSGKCQVDPATAVLAADAIVQSSDIISYKQSAFTYTLSSAAVQRIKALLGRQPFAVTVNGEVIFYGFYNPIILSSSCDHSISMDADSGGKNKVVMVLGYPGLISGTTIDDQRNNTKLINALKAAGKWRF